MSKTQWPLRSKEETDAPKDLFDGSNYALKRTGAEALCMLALSASTFNFFDSKLNALAASIASMSAVAIFFHNIYGRLEKLAWPAKPKITSALFAGFIITTSFNSIAHDILNRNQPTDLNPFSVQVPSQSWLDNFANANWWLEDNSKRPSINSKPQNKASWLQIPLP